MKRQPLHPGTQAMVMRLIADGKLIQAIKLIREATGMPLAQAKEYAERLEIEQISESVPPELESYARSLIAQGNRTRATRAIRDQLGVGRRPAKVYVEALRKGFTRPPALPRDFEGPQGSQGSQGSQRLSDRVRAFKAAHDHESAIAAVRAETGMTRPEAERFIAALD